MFFLAELNEFLIRLFDPWRNRFSDLCVVTHDALLVGLYLGCWCSGFLP